MFTTSPLSLYPRSLPHPSHATVSSPTNCWDITTCSAARLVASTALRRCQPYRQPMIPGSSSRDCLLAVCREESAAICVFTDTFVETDTARSRLALTLNDDITTPLPFYRLGASRMGPARRPQLETCAAGNRTATAQLLQSSVPGYPTLSMPTDDSIFYASVSSTPKRTREQPGIRSSALPEPLIRYMSMSKCQWRHQPWLSSVGVCV